MADSVAPGDAVLRRIDAYLNRILEPASDIERIGPFVAFFSRDSDLPFLSFARPADPLAATADELLPDVYRVAEAYAMRGFACRWEFLADTAPNLMDALRQAGFREPDVQPVLRVTPETFRPQPLPFGELRRITTKSVDLRQIVMLQRRAFGIEEPAGENDFDGLHRMLARGMRLFAVHHWNRYVAAGVHTPIDGVTEVAGIATHAEWRGRGLGAALSSALVEDAFAAGCEVVFLSAGSETAHRLYRRLGFQDIGTQYSTHNG